MGRARRAVAATACSAQPTARSHNHGHGHQPRPTATATATSRKAQGTRHKAQGTRHKAQGTRHKAQGTRHKAQGTRHKAQGTRHWHKPPPPAGLTPKKGIRTNIPTQCSSFASPAPFSRDEKRGAPASAKVRRWRHTSVCRAEPGRL
ncbi:hypothetical protein EN871_07615 [bacterium M00.F.Ca.ET.228.01.1.1]|nr:hypothetical protein EN871_07615 [bacterium M00.F.Ca.ET.228.01.1.1]TGS03785.1 hypothetical protein EN834_05370 [bacterium M00.F.Ca.ET.191.01.1.1]TGU07595.1 hypothetical protein EN798_11690 [bacterium M00.F.Ca.ET.155.01.1.1]